MLLIATGPADYAALRGASVWRGYAVTPGGLEPDEVLVMLQGWSARLQAAQGWGSWLAVRGGEVVASLAVKQPLSEGTVEIGCAVAPARRGQGFGTAAVQGLLPVLAGHGVTRVQAETEAGNIASERVLEKAGFQRTTRRLDAEDGWVQVWSRPGEA